MRELACVLNFLYQTNMADTAADTTTDGEQPVAPSLKEVALKAGDDLASKLIGKAPPAL